MKLSDFKVLTFDCYGTLIDWETGMLEALAPLVGRVKPPPGGEAVLAAHARHEHAQEGWTPTRRYGDLLATVYKRLAEEWGAAATWDEARGLRPLDRFLAGLSRHRRGARLSEATFSAGHSLQCRQCELCREPCPARSAIRCRLHGRGHRQLQALAAQFRIHAGEARDPGARQEGRAPHRRRACSTTTGRRSRPGSPAAGSTGDTTAAAALAQPSSPRRRRVTTSAS